MRIYTLTFLFAITLSCSNVSAMGRVVFGKITNQNADPAAGVKIGIEDIGTYTVTNEDGKFETPPLVRGQHIISMEFPDGEYYSESILISDDNDLEYNFQGSKIYTLDEVEVLGEQNKNPRGLEQITRFPVKIFDHIQTISVVSADIIESQGILTITDATKNVAGVTKFAGYGANKESMSIRGYRGTPVLKNGVRMDSDFRTASAISDMAGVESIQVIKGSAAITQGMGNDLGSAGGVINVISKTPLFKKSAELGIRTGSWLNSRLQYDLQTYTGVKQQAGFRLTGAFQMGKGYKNEIRNDRIYINPSFTWRPDNKTDIILEMDYLRDNITPDRGTFNMDEDSVYALYNMKKKFSGFKDDFSKSQNINYSIRAERKLNKNITARVAFFNSYFKSDQQGASFGLFKEGGETIYNKRVRGIGRSYRNDYNSTFQADIMGQDMKKGIVTWNWQVGYDHNVNHTQTRSAAGIKNIDVIDIYQDIDNSKVTGFDTYEAEKLELGAKVKTKSFYYGFMTQHYLSISEYAKLIGGVRWSYSKDLKESVWDPMVGLMISPTKNLNIFGSYTTTSNLRSASNPLEDGGTVGNSRTQQYELGIKTQWLNEKLHANITVFKAANKNLAYQLYDSLQVATGVYGLAGDLNREGVEVEIIGHPTADLKVLVGYAYLKAHYEESPAYMDGSRPMNAPSHTANGWLQYKFSKTAVKGLSLGAGVYYVGKRPVNEHTKITAVHSTVPGVKYFDMPAYTTLNMQLGYSRKRFDYHLFLNNITNEVGYTSYYRGGYINPIDPFNFSVQVNMKF